MQIVRPEHGMERRGSLTLSQAMKSSSRSFMMQSFSTPSREEKFSNMDPVVELGTLYISSSIVFTVRPFSERLTERFWVSSGMSVATKHLTYCIRVSYREVSIADHVEIFGSCT